MARRATVQADLFAPSPEAQRAKAEALREGAGQVLQAWVRYQEVRGAQVSPTERRLEVIAKAMEAGEYTATRLVVYLRWVFTAPARWPGWMRKPGHPYLEVDNLFRRSHLQEHLQEAEEWARAQGEEGGVVALYGDRSYTG